MATVSGRRVLSCPKCRQSIDVGTVEDGKQITCQHCGAHFQAKSKSRVEPEVHDGGVAEPQSESFLEWAEDLLVRMICGVYKFIFIKVPSEAYHTLVRCFPTLVRLIKVVILLAILLASIFAPSVVVIARRGIGSEWPWIEWSWLVERLPAWYLSRATLWDAIALSYTALAFLGSIWGAIYLRRRFKKKRSLAASAPSPPPLPK